MTDETPILPEAEKLAADYSERCWDCDEQGPELDVEWLALAITKLVREQIREATFTETFVPAFALADAVKKEREAASVFAGHYPGNKKTLARDILSGRHRARDGGEEV